MRNVWVRALTAFALASAVACGSEDRGITEPTAGSSDSTSVISVPPGTKKLFFHDTLNPTGTGSLNVSPSYRYDEYISMISNLAPWAWDDFTSAVTDTIRT